MAGKAWNNSTFKGQRSEAGFVSNLLAGVVIGVGGILPGVSGAVMAVSFGIYRPMLDALAGLRRNFRASFIFLLPIGLGGAIGMMSGALLLDWLIERYMAPLMFLFIGLIGGGLPAFIREANEGGGFKAGYLIAVVSGALLASLLLLLEPGSPAITGQAEVLTPLQAVIAGAIIAVGAIIPGISTSFILIYLGWYAAALAAISEIRLVTLVYFGLGALLFAGLTIKLVRWLFARYHGYAYYAVLGFLLVSIALIFPGFSGGLMLLWSLLLLVAGFILAFLFNRYFNRAAADHRF